MIKVEVPWTDQWSGANFSVELSRWCKEQGLIDTVDYNWHFIPDQRVTIFYFKNDAEMYATLFQLRWVRNDN